jgi:ABC-type polysaccharide/polyol phosphate export permease
MTALRPQLAAAAGIFRRDLTVYFSYRFRLGTQYVGVLFSLAVFYYISRLVRVAEFPSPDTYFSYAAVGVIILQVLQSTLDIPGSVRQELVAGTFERMAVSPFGPVRSILALFLFPLASAVVTMLVTLALSAIVFGVDASWSTVPAAIPVALVAAMALGAIALLFAAMVVRFKQAPGTAYVLAAISLVAGFYFPPSLLPWWLGWASDVQPFTPAVDLLRHLLVGQPLRGSAWGDVGKLIGFTAALLPVGLAGLSLAIDRGRRLGTLTEY